MLGCAKSLVKKHLGVCYERHTDYIDDNVIIQGLLGRCTGYDDNGRTIIFTNIEPILKYEALWNSEFDSSVSWNSRTIRSNSNANGNRTMNDPDLYNGEIKHHYRNLEEPTIQKFNTRRRR